MRRILINKEDWIDAQFSIIMNQPTYNYNYKNGISTGGIDGVLNSIHRSTLAGLTGFEFGTYNGYSANRISKCCHHLYGFDSWQGLPESWTSDGKISKGGIRFIDKGHFALDELPKVANNCTLVKGLFEHSLENFLDRHPELDVGFIHIDCDIYSSTIYVLNTLAERGIIRPGLIVIFNELFNYYGFEDGEMRALYEFINTSGLSRKNRKFKWLPFSGRIASRDEVSNMHNWSFKRFRVRHYDQAVAIQFI